MVAQVYKWDDMPDEVKNLTADSTHSPEDLAKIGIAIAAKRDLAKTSRQETGIEQVWFECESAYLGMDDLNRGDFAQAKWSKPATMDAPLTLRRPSNDSNGARSTAFVRMTSRYVDCGTSKVGEIALAVDDKSFAFEPTPLPEMIDAKDDNSQVVHNGEPLERDPKPEELQAAQPAAGASPVGGALPSSPPPVTGLPPPLLGAPPGAPPPPGVPGGAPQPPGEPGGVPVGAAPPGPPPGVPLRVKDLAEEKLGLARKGAKKAETRIYDWMTESNYPAQMRKVIFDAGRIGVGVLKGPFPKPRKAIARVKGEIIVNEDVFPTVEWVDPWNIFPDPSCGENIQNGDWIFERDNISARQLRELKKLDSVGYLPDQIDKVLLEGPNKVYKEEANPHRRVNKDSYEIWYYYGALSAEEMNAVRPGVNKKKKAEVYALVTMVNDTVIRATLNPLDSGKFPYHAVPWQRRAGNWAGVGIAEQVSMPQKMVNAATRAMLNNAGKSAGSQIVIDQGSIRPADGSWIMTPDKVWYKSSDATIDDVRKAFMSVEIPNMTPQLMTVIEYAFRLAEESTSIPLITQGQTGPTTPETLGATQLQNSNANQLLRSIGYSIDDYITEPMVTQYYEFLLLDDTVPDEEKGDWRIMAHGTTALVERAIQDQTIMEMGQMVINPAFDIDPPKWMAMMMKSKRLDPRDLQLTEEQKAAKAQIPPPKPPAVEVAGIKAQTEEKRLAAEAEQSEKDRQVTLQKVKVDTDRDTVFVQSTERRDQAEFEQRRAELEVKRELELLKYANTRAISLEQVKAELAGTAMKLQVTKQLAGIDTHEAARQHTVDTAADLHKHATDTQADLHKHSTDTNADMEKHYNPPPPISPVVEPPGKASAGNSFAG